MAESIVVIGAGGFGREVHDVIVAINRHAAERGEPEPWRFEGFVDDATPDPALLERRGAEWIGSVDALARRVAALASLGQSLWYVIGIGSAQARRSVEERAEIAGARAAVLVHPSAAVGLDVELGPGAVLCAQSCVTTNVRTGRHFHLNLCASVGHDVRIGDFVTINPAASVAGAVTLHDDVMLGSNSAVIQGLVIDSGTSVGAGAVVVRDLPANVTAVGVPAKVLG